MRQGIEVTAVTFLTHFGCDISDKSSCSKDPFAAAAQFGFEVKLCHLADRFIEIVKKPKFGHGKNMNPCIDCRILMLREAKVLMAMRDADFVITGEVLGQRPMSQRRDTFPKIDREAGLAGYILRPLSARLLKPTIPEQEGIVDRERLCAFHGRSRKPQIALSQEFGLTAYPAPAGGCLLTDPIYSSRLRELLEFTPDPQLKEIQLLRAGRQFRIPRSGKVIVGRHEEDNKIIESIADSNDYLLWVDGHGSPLAVASGTMTEEALGIAASLCARYSDAKALPAVDVSVKKNGACFTMQVSPASDEMIDEYMIPLPATKEKESKR
jgi:tRNA U34 2-thiouridine synthase MnmA/TrmU